MQRNLASIIICTRDRAESLRQTLSAIGECTAPADLAVEVLVVDNGSQDRTRTVVRQAKCWDRPPRYLFEPRRGLAHARNAAIVAAQGEVLLWINDDILPGGTWIEAMTRPLLDGRADAVAGCVRHEACRDPRAIRCVEEDLADYSEGELAGANMSFARRVLEKVPAFDLELGPGSLGCCDDTLFSMQLGEAGFRAIGGGEPSLAAQQCGETYSSRTTQADAIAQDARSRAYIDYHWRHASAPLAVLHRASGCLELAVLRVLQRLWRKPGEAIGHGEARRIWRSAYYSQFVLESRRPRHYERLGLRKLPESVSPEDVYATAMAVGQSRRAA